VPAQHLDSQLFVDVSARPTDAGTDTGHHPRGAPTEHLCTCGRLREDCVREAVRAVWSATPGGTQHDQDGDHT